MSILTAFLASLAIVFLPFLIFMFVVVVIVMFLSYAIGYNITRKINIYLAPFCIYLMNLLAILLILLILEYMLDTFLLNISWVVVLSVLVRVPHNYASLLLSMAITRKKRTDKKFSDGIIFVLYLIVISLISNFISNFFMGFLSSFLPSLMASLICAITAFIIEFCLARKVIKSAPIVNKKSEYVVVKSKKQNVNDDEIKQFYDYYLKIKQAYLDNNIEGLKVTCTEKLYNQYVNKINVMKANNRVEQFNDVSLVSYKKIKFDSSEIELELCLNVLEETMNKHYYHLKFINNGTYWLLDEEKIIKIETPNSAKV